MKRINLTLLLLIMFMGGMAQTQLPSEKYMDLYKTMTQDGVNADKMIELLQEVQLPTSEKPYFDIVLMRLIGEEGKKERLDSIHEITRNGFERINNQFMLLKTDFEYGSFLNGEELLAEALPFLKSLTPTMEKAILEIQDNKSYKELLAMTYYEIGYNQFSQGILEEGVTHAQKSIEILIALNDTVTLMEAYNLLGVLYKRQNKLDEAIREYQKALEMSISKNDQRLSRIIMNNISSLYNSLDRPDKALALVRKVMQYFPPQYGTTFSEQVSYMLDFNLVGVLLSNANLSQNSIDTLRLAIAKINDQTPDGLKLLLYTNIGKAFNQIDQRDSTFSYLSAANKLRNNTNNAFNLANLDYLYGTTLALKSDSAVKAQKHLKQALEYYRRNPEELLCKTLISLAQLEADHFHNYKLSTELLKEAYNYTKEEDLNRYQKRLASFEAEFKTKEKEIELVKMNALHEKEKAEYEFHLLLIFTILVIAILLSIVLALYIRRKRILFKMKEIELKSEIAERDYKAKLLMQNMEFEMKQRYINGLEDSNNRMAKELHDGICHRLLFLEMNISNNLPKEMLTDLKEIRKEVRTLSHELASPEFKYATLIEVLRAYIDKLMSTETFKVDYYIDERIEHINLDPKAEFEIYRLMQESVNNIVKHAQAHKIYFSLTLNDETIDLIIEDDGVGFDVGNHKEGLGMRTMKERIASLNGKLNIESKINKGTFVHIWFPYVKFVVKKSQQEI